MFEFGWLDFCKQENITHPPNSDITLSLGYEKVSQFMPDKNVRFATQGAKRGGGDV